ncbi:MAG: MlaD family protein [Rickettsiaceae bacterium]|nr:MlaD family protein [Rickettsiaceae bacterium]
MKYSILETTIGLAFVFIVLIFSGMLFRNNEKVGIQYYSMLAECDNASGVTNGTVVTIAGIKVGYVDSITLNEKNYNAHISIKLNKDIKLPKDSTAAIVTDGFFGNKLIKIDPGIAEQMFGHDDYIPLSSSVNLENILNKLLYNFSNSKANSTN